LERKAEPITNSSSAMETTNSRLTAGDNRNIHTARQRVHAVVAYVERCQCASWYARRAESFYLP
jgi:hypothetical protein